MVWTASKKHTMAHNVCKPTDIQLIGLFFVKHISQLSQDIKSLDQGDRRYSTLRMCQERNR